MEQALLTAGRIIAGLLVLVAVFLLVFLLMGTAFVHAASRIPATIARTLAEEDFYSQAAQVALTSMLDALPDEIKTVGAAISKVVLNDSLRNVGLAVISRQIVPREWLQQQLVTNLTRPAEDAGAGADTGLVRALLRGESGSEVANLVVNAARECTDGEVQRLLNRVRGTDSGGGLISFICNPPTVPDVNLRTVMQDVVVVTLAQVADQIVENTPNPLESVEVEDIGVDTPVGRLRFQWPAVHLATGAIDLAYALPDSVQQSVETSVTQLQTQVQAVSDQVSTQVAESRANLGLTLNETPTPDNPPTEEVVEETPAAEATETSALATVQSNITSSVEAALETLNARLTELAASVNLILVIVFGGSLVLLLISVLFLVRTFRGVGMWAGAVLLASGVLVILLNSALNAGQIATYPPRADLSESAMQLRAVLMDAVSSAVRSELTRPINIGGIVFILIGAALLVYLVYVNPYRPSFSDS